jgi:hypothetical protein
MDIETDTDSMDTYDSELLRAIFQEADDLELSSSPDLENIDSQYTNEDCMYEQRGTTPNVP